jgi:hypothetical protein
MQLDAGAVTRNRDQAERGLLTDDRPAPPADTLDATAATLRRPSAWKAAAYMPLTRHDAVVGLMFRASWSQLFQLSGAPSEGAAGL